MAGHPISHHHKNEGKTPQSFDIVVFIFSFGADRYLTLLFCRFGCGSADVDVGAAFFLGTSFLFFLLQVDQVSCCGSFGATGLFWYALFVLHHFILNR